ncbi:7504_t:CDS:2 [Acaulospora morrowiae]|uniref:7504_t:CDS:1 n=1 Tax=Acaulospora morrowiae TaxID=94023 RepID=A0A9N9IMP3_9GLOM|nr:7504_t:CDS:2 [Acaulospora morrowiae]
MASTTSIHIPAPVWLYFDPPIEVESGKKKARCKLCLTNNYLTVNNSGISNLRTHVINIHKIDISSILSSEDLAILFSQSGEHLLRETLIEWIVKDCLLFTTVESESFHKLFEVIRKLEGNITILSASTIKRDLLEYYSVSKASLKETLGNNSSKISLTTDIWTSNSCKEIQSHILDLAPFKEPYSGINIANTLITFESFSLEIGNSFTQQQGHIRYIAHIINLALQDFLFQLRSEAPDQDNDDINILSQTNTSNTQVLTIKKLCMLIAKLQHLPQHRQRLIEICTSLNIQHMNPILDSKTRWNSTLNMLEQAITMAPALSRIVRKIPELSEFDLLPQE